MKSRQTVLLLFFIVAIITIQFFRVDRTLPISPPSNDIFSVLTASEEIQTMVKSACYDCHSNHTNYPWYSYVAPISWILQDHITNGRKHLNFSNWADYPKEKSIEKLEDCFEVMAKEEMPLNEYQWLHQDAKLSEAERVKLISWFRKSKLNTKTLTP
jgi:hypothetical protein